MYFNLGGEGSEEFHYDEEGGQPVGVKICAGSL